MTDETARQQNIIAMNKLDAIAATMPKTNNKTDEEKSKAAKEKAIEKKKAAKEKKTTEKATTEKTTTEKLKTTKGKPKARPLAKANILKTSCK